MVKPDFTKIWAGSRVSIPDISEPDYVKGFAAYLGPLPPQTDDHDYIMNLQDLRALWLEQELAAKTAAATDTTAGIVQLAVAANYPSASDSDASTPAYIAAALAGVSGIYSAYQLVTSATTFSITHVGRAISINSATATAHNLPAASTYASGKAITFGNINTGIATFNRAGSDTITGCNLSAATSIPLNNGENVTLVSDGVSKWTVAASNVTFFGAPQVLQSVFGSRVIGTTYTNSTGRPIYVYAYVTFASGSGNQLTFVVNGINIYGSVVANSSNFSCIYTIIPSGGTYSMSNANTPVIAAWNELR